MLVMDVGGILIILDDVDQTDQLFPLAGQQDWFSQGSRVFFFLGQKKGSSTRVVGVCSPVVTFLSLACFLQDKIEVSF